MRIAIVVLIAAGSLGNGLAQNVANVEGVASRATVMLSDGEYRGCGMRFVGMDLDPRAIRFPVYTFDFNVSLMKFGQSSLGVVLKTELTQARSERDLQRASGPLMKVGSTWLQPEGREPWKAAKSGIAGENGLSSMSTYQLTPNMLEYLLEVANGEDTRLLLGVTLAGNTNTRVYRFHPQLQKEDAAAFLSCSKAMVDQTLKEAERK